MKTQPHKSSYLPLLFVGIAVILFSTAGIAAIKGWLPAPTDASGNIIPSHNSAVELAKADALTAHAAQRLAKAKARANGTCAECGFVVSTGEINGHDDDFGISATGASLAGDRNEKSLNSSKSYEIIVRMADGSIRALTHAHPANWRPGARVIIIDGTNPSRR
jgi:hypothetical protein